MSDLHLHSRQKLASVQFGDIRRSSARVTAARTDCSCKTGKRLSLRIRRGEKEIRMAVVLRFNKCCISYWDLNIPVTLLPTKLIMLHAC